MQPHQILPRPNASAAFRSHFPVMATIYQSVADLGLPNYRGARIPVPHDLNISAWRKRAHMLTDASLIDMPEFGFPVGFAGKIQPAVGLGNHSSATANPEHADKYIDAEVGHEAMIGPFEVPPFEPWFRSNPAMTRPKRDSAEFRAILDMSFPDGHSVNSAIPLSQLDGAPFKLRLPMPSDLAAIMRRCGPGCLLYKVDLSRAYRQLRSDPLDWPFLGLAWRDRAFVDVSVLFGLRHGASACQRTTEAVAAMARHETGAEIEPYVDDSAGGATPDKAWGHYEALLALMKELGLDAAPHKSSPPSTFLLWIGVIFNSLTMTMAIDPAKIEEARELCFRFLMADHVTYKHMQSFIGKVFHVTKCSPPARRFTSRILDLFRAMHDRKTSPISLQAKMDTSWLLAFLPRFNGISLIKSEMADHVAQVDACLTGAGGICDNFGYYSLQFPEEITECVFSISSLECYNILVACRLWAAEWSGKHVLLYSDNWAAVCALNSGTANDPLIRASIREIWWLIATHDVELTVRHRPGASMLTADALSRRHTSQAHADRLGALLFNRDETEREIVRDLLLPPIPI